MGNWRTTLAAVVTAFAAILAHFGLEVSPEVQNIILYIGLLAVGIFAGDAGKNQATIAPGDAKQMHP